MGVRLTIRGSIAGVLSEELKYEFDQERIAIGRGPGADIRIPHLCVSEAHATLRAEDGGYVIIDHGSTNGTRVNGATLPKGRKKRLSDGDTIDIGAYALEFESGVAIARPTTMERTSELARRLFRQAHASAQLGGPRLVVLTGAHTGKSLSIPPPPSRLLVGSADACQLALPDTAMLAEHAEVVRDLDGVLIRSLQAEHAMKINERSVIERRLRDGDELVMGGSRLLFEEPAEESMEALTGEPDQVFTATRAPSAQPSITSTPSQASPPTPEPVKAPSVREPARAASQAPARGLDADILVYVLAFVVIASSLAGLWVLLRGQ